MFKKLLSIAAVAFVAYSASAADPVVLWQADDAEGVLVDWGQPCYKMTAAEVNAAIAPGDYVNMVVSGVTEGGWPQVAIFGENGGWPPLANSGVGGQNYPYTVVMPITYDIFDTISKDGLSFSGNGAYVNEVSYTKGMEISENTVWFGDKACGWGNGVSIPSTTFENVKIGDQLKFWTSDQSYQVLLGGWSGLNLPCYAAGSFANAKYEDGVYTITMAGKYAGEAEYDVDGDTKAYDVFALLKANGVVMHGTTTITRIDYIPTDEDIAADMAADEEEVAMVKEAMEELNAMAESWPGYLVLKAEEVAAVTTTLEGWEKSVPQNIATCMETGVYEGIPANEVVTTNETVMALSADFEPMFTAAQEELMADEEAVEELAANYAELIATTESDCAGVLTLKAEDVAKVDAAIEETTNALEEAQNELLLNGVYPGIQTELVAATESLMSLSGEIEGAYNAILEGSAEDDAAIEEISDALAELLENAEAEFKGFLNLKAEDITAAKAAVQALNDAYNKAIETALAETGEYTGIPQADVVAANEAVMSLAAEYTAAYEAVLNDSLEDDEAIAEIESNLAQFEEETTESFPGYLVANAEEVDALKAQIADLNEAYNAALETALAETGVYVGPQAEIVAATEALMSLAAGVDAAVAAIEEGYEADVKIMNELAVAMQELNAMIEEEDFPGYAALKADDIAKVNKGIESLNDQINAGMEAAFETGVYEGPSQAEIVELTETVMSLGADFEPALNAILKAAQADYDYIEMLDEYMAYLDEWCAEEFPGYPVYKADDLKKINAGLAELNKQYEDARYEALNETGVYAGIDYTLLNEVYAEILDYHDGSDALMEQADELVAEDFAQYDDLATALEELENDAQFPAFAEIKAAEFEAANAALDALYAAMENGVANFFETCEYAGPTQAEFAAATEQVMALVTEQAEMLAAIQNPYEEDLATLQAYMDKVKDVLDGDEYSEESEAYLTALEVAATVEELKALVNEEYVAALTETGEYNTPITKRDIRALDNMIKYFDTTGIDSIDFEAAGIKYYDLNGTNVTNPVSGKVYIRVINGKSQKVLVK